MCGIAGFLINARLTEAWNEVLARMTDALAHRGPDGRGMWTNPDIGVALGHRRLAIVDLTDAGHQPMVSRDQRFVLSYNGEIYNAPEIRADLASSGHLFRGHSDTEVFVEAASAWGVRKTVDRLTGMFAAAIWDVTERRLYLVRDRIGIKPLYWGFIGPQFVFGSELKAIVDFPGFSRKIDTAALCDYFRYGVVHAPRSIYKGIHKLRPGTILEYSGAGAPAITTYWNLNDKINENGDRCTDELDDLLPMLVRQHLVSDVPIGSFLSGGVDSSLVTSLANVAVEPKRATSFTAGFGEKEFDESHHARLIAEQIGTNHVELRVAPNDALGLIESLPQHYDEPFADSSQLPTLLISRLARQHVTVALTGDGGDELFAGYSRYFWANRIAGLGPRGLRSVVGTTLRNAVQTMVPTGANWRERRSRFIRFAELVVLPDAMAMHDNLLAVCRTDLSAKQIPCRYQPHHSGEASSTIGKMQMADTLRYLPDDILTKVDRASMAFGLEARVPFLDHRLVELAFSIPTERHTEHGVGKALLKKQLATHIPSNLFERPKQGFGTPIGRWLDGPLRPWAEELLSETRLKQTGFFDPNAVAKTWAEHRTGRRNRHSELWMVLSLQQWSRHWRASL